ncbi:tyrosine--tRNA ligase [Candidatus Blochmanniella vafra]|uniref:tyrosine--tRNA ligase n=1 Tax=Candidatus Blochmanniella vafra TaxID=251535 RepID=UPI0005C45DAC
MTNVDVINYLYERGFIAQITNKNILNSILQSKSITLYCGFDPTSDSLHIGHLVPLLCLKKFQKFGHKPIILLGGATGLIGDPSFKDSERQLNPMNTIQQWIEKIKSQISSFIDLNSKNHPHNIHIVNNYTWFSSTNILTFLRDIGKFFSINKMINKDFIKKRLKEDNCGISYTEFSYNLMQSYDFFYLYKNYGVILQIGGSDQWGNIISGIDLIRRIYNKKTYGITVPLLTTINNIKFGKTEKNTIWIDPNKTSPYKFYQYWLNIDDKQVCSFLKIFTDMNIEQINFLEKKMNNNYFIPITKTTLAEKITKLIHGKQGLKSAQRITKNIFYDHPLDLTLEDFNQLAKDGIPSIILKKDITLQQALVESKLATSKSQARYFIESHAITINKIKQLNKQYIFNNTDRLFNSYTLLKKGKKHSCLIQWK